jgi:hypothetical protein
MDSIAQALQQFTATISNFDTERDYVSMSHAGMDAQEIIRTIENGFEDSLSIRLRCYKGYQMERDLLERLKKLLTNRIVTPVELVAFDGIVKGHPDFLLDDYPGDCKTVPLEEYLPENSRRIPRKVFFQMQAYMLYARKDKAVVVYEARDTGAIRDYWLTANPTIMGAIDHKYRSEVVPYWKSRKGVISA